MVRSLRRVFICVFLLTIRKACGKFIYWCHCGRPYLHSVECFSDGQQWVTSFTTTYTAIMYPEVTIVIGRKYWRCITCKLLNKRVVSIDQHVQLKHPDIQQPHTEADRLDDKQYLHETASYSDGEIDCCRYKCISLQTELLSESHSEDLRSERRPHVRTAAESEINNGKGKMTKTPPRAILTDEHSKKRRKEIGIRKRSKAEANSGNKTSKMEHHPSVAKKRKSACEITTVSSVSVQDKQRSSKMWSLNQQENHTFDYLSKTDSKQLSVEESLCFSVDSSHVKDKHFNTNRDEVSNIKANCTTHYLCTGNGRKDTDSVQQFTKALHADTLQDYNDMELKDFRFRKQRPNRKAAERSELIKGEEKTIKETYVACYKTKNGLTEQKPLQLQGTDDASKIVRNLHMFGTLSSPNSQELTNARESTLEKETEGVHLDFQSYSGLIQSESSTSSAEYTQQSHHQHLGSQHDLGTSGLSTSKDFTLGQMNNGSFKKETASKTEKSIVPNMLSFMTKSPQNFAESQTCGLDGLSETFVHEHMSNFGGTQSFVVNDDLGKDKDWVRVTNFNFSNVQQVQIVNTPKQISCCKICQAKFSTPENLTIHEAKMAAFGVTCCKQCEQKFHGLHLLNLHVFSEHEVRKKGFCFECGETFQTMEKLERHVYAHIQNKECMLTKMRFHECRICNRETVCEYAVMQSHYYSMHRAILCLDCYIKSEIVYFTDATAVKEHKQSHETVCSLCSEEFPTVQQLHAHYFAHNSSQVEEDGGGNLCEKCSQWCPNRASGMLHEKWHKLQQAKEKRALDAQGGFVCLRCSKEYRSKRNLDRHTARAHSQNRTYKFQCEFCGKGMDSKSCLKDHIALHHLGIKRYACEYCDQRFVCNPTLRRHVLREHATDKQYSCKFCGSRFCDRVKLERHMFTHTGMARFMCEQCGKGFHTSSEFHTHMAVHSVTRDFVCHVCGQDYKRKEHLRRHLRSCKKVAQACFSQVILTKNH